MMTNHNMSSRDLHAETTSTCDDITGRNVEAIITSTRISDHVTLSNERPKNEESKLCYLFGVLLHLLFSGEEAVCTKLCDPQMDNKSHGISEEVVNEKSAKKKTSAAFPSQQNIDLLREFPTLEFESNESNPPPLDLIHQTFRPLIDLGCPPSLSHLITNLLDCRLGFLAPDDAYSSLDAAIEDLHLLLQDPARFLVEEYNVEAIVSVGRDKLYGRSKEEQKLKDIFCRVASTGKNEAIFIGGFSGCGKTSLVQSLFEAVQATGGYFVLTPKLDELQTRSPLSALMSAFDELCKLVLHTNSLEILAEISQKLVDTFGASSYLLARVIPNVANLVSSNFINQPIENQVNFSSLCLIVQGFVRVISSFSRPIVLVVDDLQWADKTTLGILLAVLSDVNGSNVLVIGSYRDNENEHSALVEFFGMISSFNVTICEIHLDGIPIDDLNAMLADTLRIFPRLCKPLSSLVYQKTRGNPFFALEFLHSLIDRNIVSYSLRDKGWRWDLDQVGAENITENVLFLLTSKITSLPNDAQTALKAASCFGNRISVAVVKELSATPRYHDLKMTLDKALTKEFMDCDGTSYRFVHSKVREAAYGLISPGEKDRYHFDIGMALQTRIVGQNTDDDVLFAAIDHINHGGPSLIYDPSHRISIIELNLQAGVKLMKSHNYTSSHSYLKTALSLLPDDRWSSHYNLSLQCHFHLAKAAYPCGFIDDAKALLLTVIEHASCLEDKLDTYSLLVTVHHLAFKDISKAFSTCIEVLKLLGEDLPDRDIDKHELVAIVAKCKSLFQRFAGKDFLQLPRNTCWKSLAIMRFYSELSSVAFFVEPSLNLFLVTKWALYCLNQKVICKHTPGALVSFSAVMCRASISSEICIGCKVGRMGLNMLHEMDLAMDELPRVHLCYYMFIGIFTEPIQACADMHRRASELAMNLGNNLMASFNMSVMLHRSLYGGSNLETLKVEIESHWILAKQHSLQMLEYILKVYGEVVIWLIGNCSPVTNNVLSDLDVPEYEEISFMYQMFLSLFLGHMERVIFMAKKWESLDIQLRMKEPVRFIYNTFISGLASACWYRKGRQKAQLRENVRKSLAILKDAAELSKWNFQNKFNLLNAMNLSNQEKNAQSSKEFNIAIIAARSSKFHHEEGLACELAGIHNKRIGNNEEAMRLFHLAQGCYKAWGSQVKVQQMATQIELVKSISQTGAISAS
eukprot:CCRYP_013989-RA/>CCRYP_013989-RA protein AED:0.06 eAED:0.06 QI:199/1/1/1/0.75/0.6/5/431/1198